MNDGFLPDFGVGLGAGPEVLGLVLSRGVAGEEGEVVCLNQTEWLSREEGRLSEDLNPRAMHWNG